jgi:predicted aspartyl protease
MTGAHFLVIQRQAFDEIPLRLFDNESDAREFARTCPWEIPEHIASIEGMEFSDPVNISIVGFANGIPCLVEEIRSTDDEAIEAVG